MQIPLHLTLAFRVYADRTSVTTGAALQKLTSEGAHPQVRLPDRSFSPAGGSHASFQLVLFPAASYQCSYFRQVLQS